MVEQLENLNIAVCVTVHNRKAKTMACLRSLYGAELPPGSAIDVFMVDDSSTDGTPEAVAQDFPQVKLIRGSGDLYWAGGMRLSYEQALRGEYDYFIWLNDDVELRPNAIKHLLETEREIAAREGRRSLVSGAMWDPRLGAQSYGAYALIARHRPHERLINAEPDRPVHGDMLNANLLLIPDEVARAIGNIPRGFRHSLADWDYSMRAQGLGFGTYLAAGYVGDCEANNKKTDRWGAPGMTLIERYRRILHPLGLHLPTRSAYLLKHFRALGWLYLIGPYVRLPLDHVSRFRG